MRDIENLLDFWEKHDSEELVLATIIRKQYSSYRAVGAKKIISREDACGLLSGGCLETEIICIARQYLCNLPLLKTFSTTLDSDRFFGYQTGCRGMIEILFETLPARTRDKSLYIPYGGNRLAEGVAVELGEANLGRRRFASPPSANDADLFYDLFYDPWIEPVTLCVVGCGPDAPALFEMADMMGWRILLLDYRPDYVATGPLTTICPLDDIASRIPEGKRVAVILMTHNYGADLHILNGLNGKLLGYLGCLGPCGRFEQLKADLWTEFGAKLSPSLESIIHAPAGMFSSGRFPEEIAVSIVSEIQSILRSSPSLRPCLI